ncbi:MAG: ribonuclease HII [Rhodospirillales bacterium]
MPDFSLEAVKPQPCCGVDEAGRGPWAGPVVAGAAILVPEACPPDFLARLDDSKKLKTTTREELFHWLSHHAETGVGIASVEEIKELNILGATLLAMRRAVEALPNPAAFALVDGNRLPDLPCPAETVIKGDGRSFSIAAASIMAKVSRDRIMADLARQYPGYGWETNQGYGTAVHVEALHRLGPTPHHRRGFKPVQAVLEAATS